MVGVASSIDLVHRGGYETRGVTEGSGHRARKLKYDGHSQITSQEMSSFERRLGQIECPSCHQLEEGESKHEFDQIRQSIRQMDGERVGPHQLRGVPLSVWVLIICSQVAVGGRLRTSTMGTGGDLMRLRWLIPRDFPDQSDGLPTRPTIAKCVSRGVYQQTRQHE